MRIEICAQVLWVFESVCMPASLCAGTGWVLVGATCFSFHPRRDLVYSFKYSSHTHTHTHTHAVRCLSKEAQSQCVYLWMYVQYLSVVWNWSLLLHWHYFIRASCLRCLCIYCKCFIGTLDHWYCWKTKHIKTDLTHQIAFQKESKGGNH